MSYYKRIILHEMEPQTSVIFDGFISTRKFKWPRLQRLIFSALVKLGIAEPSYKKIEATNLRDVTIDLDRLVEQIFAHINNVEKVTRHDCEFLIVGNDVWRMLDLMWKEQEERASLLDGANPVLFMIPFDFEARAAIGSQRKPIISQASA